MDKADRLHVLKQDMRGMGRFRKAKNVFDQSRPRTRKAALATDDGDVLAGETRNQRVGGADVTCLYVPHVINEGNVGKTVL
ncbi:hypothetical protein PPNSA23_28370 [Phyllobacterium phragmitis]|uniref:Uncharacterized protein n=1 Tax=Phyllobacterium phragmitis TaxID=2670329 RepID=A0ABQ0H1V1_9HYPH